MSTTKDTFQDADVAGPHYVEAADTILDDLRSRNDEIPQWEFCEGFMAALIVCRQRIDVASYLNVLLDMEYSPAPGCDFHAPFVSAEQQRQFMEVWQRRWSEIEQELAADVDNLGDEGAYYPLVIDVAGMVHQLPEADRAAMAGQTIPSYAQVWALGFMYMVENWPQEWAPPRDREQRKILESAMQALVDLTEFDADVPTISVYDDAAPPTVSQQRMEAFAAALWSVYELYALFRELGPRVETVYSVPKPGRNDPCHCGSGKKYKKCHGA